ncbi:MAG: peptidylprolyl isomerase [Gammaproteobacteria bacterium]|nr:peptidylprolyl isomerase [Gammaproteobacteria bacterium]
MKSISIWLLSFLLLVLGILIGIQIAASPMIADLGAGRQAPVAETPATSEPSPAARETEPGQAKQQTPAKLRLEDIERVLANAEAGQRRQVLDDAELFRRFVEQEATNRSLKAAAMANDMHENDDIRFLMKRAGDNVLRETYINRLMQDQLPEDFPSEAQVRQFYEDNPDRFTVKERLQVWQVFLPVAADAGPDQAAAVEQRARQILEQILGNKLTFAQAAVEHSAHDVSRQNDGYMGSVRIGELKPAIAAALEDIEEGELGLVRSDDGWHILKKGRTLAAEQLPFENARQQARRLLISQARQQFREAVNEEARRTYAFMPNDNRIKQWRQELKTVADSTGDSGE